MDTGKGLGIYIPLENDENHEQQQQQLLLQRNDNSVIDTQRQNQQHHHDYQCSNNENLPVTHQLIKERWRDSNSNYQPKQNNCATNSAENECQSSENRITFYNNAIAQQQPSSSGTPHFVYPRYFYESHHGYLPPQPQPSQHAISHYYHHQPPTPQTQISGENKYSTIPAATQCSALTCASIPPQYTNSFLHSQHMSQHLQFYSHPNAPIASVVAQSLQEYTSLASAATNSNSERALLKKGRKFPTSPSISSSKYEETNAYHGTTHQHQQQQRKGDQLKCSNCGVRETPAWRRDLQGIALLCNSCGLYLKNKGVHRPTERAPDGTIRLKRASKQESEISCSNCHTKNTPCWRGNQNHKLCNKCGLFLKTHGYPRPPSPELRARRGLSTVAVVFSSTSNNSNNVHNDSMTVNRAESHDVQEQEQRQQQSISCTESQLKPQTQQQNEPHSPPIVEPKQDHLKEEKKHKQAENEAQQQLSDSESELNNNNNNISDSLAKS
ncbi:1847_t:CDS:2 [Ambispora leptoticha]|uniref:1847_t:CDS:1 n=1 Tax=Ambispora leptoticha TaxID=144679 RepID=A0A9N9FH47_9GLOM|nr:1847_t:CDS:2 [Ambispora leptoticha]